MKEEEQLWGNQEEKTCQSQIEAAENYGWKEEILVTLSVTDRHSHAVNIEVSTSDSHSETLNMVVSTTGQIATVTPWLLYCHPQDRVHNVYDDPGSAINRTDGNSTYHGKYTEHWLELTLNYYPDSEYLSYVESNFLCSLVFVFNLSEE